MGDERRINQLTAKAYDNIGSSDYFAVDNASEAESKKLPASSIKTPISNLQGEVTGGSDTYSSTKNYSVGMYVTHTTSGVQKLYRCKTACTAASWTTNASCFEEANLADAVSQLNNDLNDMFKIVTSVIKTTTTGVGTFTISASVTVPNGYTAVGIVDISSSRNAGYTITGSGVTNNPGAIYIMGIASANTNVTFGGNVLCVKSSLIG